MSKLRQAAQLTLDELADARDYIWLLDEGGIGISEEEILDKIANAMIALKAALAEPVQEPVPSAWRYKDTARICDNSDKRMTAPPGWVPLYSAPPPEVLAPRTDAPQRKPLADEELERIISQHVRITDPNLSGAVYMAMRELEAAHGIEP